MYFFISKLIYIYKFYANLFNLNKSFGNIECHIYNNKAVVYNQSINAPSPFLFLSERKFFAYTFGSVFH